MSVTHPDAGFAAAKHHGFASDHPHLMPFLVAVAIFAVTVAVVLSFIGLPA
jgi:hypothetical protein